MINYELKKTNSRGTSQLWKATVNGNKITYEWGQEGGARNTKVQVIKSGKNIGRANETTAEEQAIFTAENKIINKMNQGFVLVKGKLTSDHSKKTVVNETVPKIMHADKYVNHHKKVDHLPKVIVQPKLDGNRCMVNIKTGKMYARSRKEIVSIPHLGDIIKEACKHLRDVTWVDGELFSMDLSFNEIQSIIRTTKQVDVKEAEKIKYNIFDYMSMDVAEVRVKNIDEFVEESDRVKIVPSYITDPSRIQHWHDKFVDQGHEGVMIRLMGFPYENKHSYAIFKYKMFVDEEFEVVGFTTERGDDKRLGAIICKMKDGQEFKARPMGTDAERNYMLSHQKEFIGRMATIKFQKYDENTGKPIFGVLKGFRDEKDMSEEE